MVSLSEQNLVDCTVKNGNHGCHGGVMNFAFKYIKDNGGIDTETSYPYEAEEETCRYRAENSGATDKGIYRIPPGNEEALKKAIATKGPAAIGINASLRTFQFYKGGVYYDRSCSPQNINHAVSCYQ